MRKLIGVATIAVAVCVLSSVSAETYRSTARGVTDCGRAVSVRTITRVRKARAASRAQSARMATKASRSCAGWL